MAYSKLNGFSKKLRSFSPEWRAACFAYADLISRRELLEESKLAEERLKEEKKAYIRVEREKLRKREQKRLKRLADLKSLVPDSCLNSANEFNREYQSRQLQMKTFTSKKTFLSKAMIRLKEICKAEAEKEADSTLRPPKNLNATGIIAKHDKNHDEIIRSLKGGVLSLIKWRLFERYHGFTCNGVTKPDDGNMFKVLDERKDWKKELFKMLPWSQAKDYIVHS